VRRRLALAAAALSLLVLLSLLVWQGSFSFSFAPSDLRETIILWAVSTLIFLLTVTLGFMLFRSGVKTYIDRQSHKEGSRIRSKLLVGALVLTLAPTAFCALFNYTVLNRTLEKWFTLPARNLRVSLGHLESAYMNQSQSRVQAEANWIGLLPETRQAADTGRWSRDFFHSVCTQSGIHDLVLQRKRGGPITLCGASGKHTGPLVNAKATVKEEDGFELGTVSVVSSLAADPSVVNRLMAEQLNLGSRKKFYQDTYFLLICLITLFVLFFAAWCAQILSRQISVPISALLGAAEQIRQGNLSYRVRVRAIDELATLVRAFNAMTNELEANARELESRRRFTEAILESIPTGVISIAADERIERVNRALSGIFPREAVVAARQLRDLFQGDDLEEIRYLLKRARRTGAAASQIDLERASGLVHLAVTVASLERQRGFVLVLEDTSDLLRAQKVEAWQEVARRIAHEIKNPLTPISLSAGRIERQLLRTPIDPDARAILDDCTQTIQHEVQAVKLLVDEFSQFARFPAAQPVPADLNEIVESAMSVFADRLDGISVTLQLDSRLPLVLADKEQIRRVIVNLVDNAAEAMTDAPVRALLIATRQAAPDLLELSVTDTGCGLSVSDKEKLFMPYFSTKQRGTGLGLAIVSHIVTEHHGRVRAEDNYPSGARFLVELNALASDIAAPQDTAEPQPATL
jgi:nitrogen fixation/metabolism regulation signal transduction histidine kinase